jgi:catechol 2,3-dioxygenase-like lactoylglutathione lyase family enzyme
MLAAGRFGTNDLDRAKTFYDGIAPLLGATAVITRDDLVAYRGADGGLFLIGKPFAGFATVGNGAQMAFGAPNREAVDAAYAKAMEFGVRCEGPPGERGPGFYAAYFRDLDGNKLVVAHMSQG